MSSLKDLFISYKQLPTFIEEPIHEPPSIIDFIKEKTFLKPSEKIQEEIFPKIEELPIFRGFSQKVKSDNESYEGINYEIKTNNVKGLSKFNEAYDNVEREMPEARKYRKFLTKIAEAESNFNSSIKNRAGAPAYGYFQFMQDGKKYNNITRHAKTDINTFRNSPELQIKAAISLAKEFESQFSQQDRLRARSKGFSIWGMLGGAWLGGAGGVKRFLRGAGDSSDKHWSSSGKGSTVGTYMRKFN